MTRTRMTSIALASVSASVLAAVAARRWKQLRRRIFDLEVDAETAVVRERVHESEVGRRRHAAVNALVAVEGAALILGRTTLSAPDRAAVNGVLTTGFDSLRRLVMAEDLGGDEPVRLADVVREVAADPRWYGRIQLDLTPDAVGCGSFAQTTEALSQLLTYVSRRVPSGPLTVRGQHEEENFVLWLDVGAAEPTPREEPDGTAGGRQGVRADTMPLHVATRLIRGEGGDLRIQDRIGGGRSYGLSLPRPPADGAPVLDDHHAPSLPLAEA